MIHADFNAQAELRPYLGRTEKLLWAGHPKRGLMFVQRDLIEIPFSMIWLAIGIHVFLATAPALVTATVDAPLALRLVFLALCTMLVFSGIYWVAGRFLVDAHIRKHTVYGLTNERVLILETLSRRKLTSINLRTLTEISLRLSAPGEGEGTIQLGPSPVLNRLSRRMALYEGQPQPTLMVRVRDARAVYDLIRDLQNKGGK